MRTIRTVVAGRCAVALWSDGSVSVYDRENAEAVGDAAMHLLAATSAAGCDALADAFREIAIEHRRSRMRTRLVDQADEPFPLDAPPTEIA